MQFSRPLAPLLYWFSAASLLASCSEEAPRIQVYHPLPRTSTGYARRAVLITCDALRPDMLGAYGNRRGLTPNLDRLSEEAIVYDQTFAPSTITVPSLSSMFTGLTPKALGGELQNQMLVPESVDTFTEILAAGGVATGAFVSNWVLRFPVMTGGKLGVAQGFGVYDAEGTVKELRRNEYERLAPDTTAAAIEWLEELAAIERDDFFLWVHYIDPHGPYTPPEGLRARFERTAPFSSPDMTLPAGRNHSGLGQVPKYQVLPGEPPTSVYFGQYDGEVSYMDQAVGELLDWLRAHDLYEDTLIVFTADHGEAMGEHNYWFCHGESLLREQVEIPLIVRFPAEAGAAQPSRRRGLSSLYDVRPTILEAFGYRGAAGHGRSLLAPVSAPRVVAQELLKPGEESYAVFDGRYHLVCHAKEPAKLFDLTNDPGERRDLAREFPGIVRQLQGAYESEWLPPPLWRGGALKARVESDTERAAMEALGYSGGD